MTRWEHKVLGVEAFPAGLSLSEISQFFTLEPIELAAVRKCRGSNNRLAVALQVGFLKMTGGLLNSTDLIPSPILKHIALQLGGEVSTPVVASIRALYRKRRRTLFDHQAAAMQVIGFEHFTGSAQPHLVLMLRKGAADCFDLEGLIEHARVWLYERRFVVLTSRTLRSLAVAARRWRDDAVISEIRALVARPARNEWLKKLQEIGDAETGATRMEWLRGGPTSKRPQGLEDQVKKIEFLKLLGADKLTVKLSLAGLLHYARPFAYRKSAALSRMKEDRFTLEAGCFLRLELLRQTDRTLEALDHRIADLWRAAKDRVDERQHDELRLYRGLALKIHVLLGDDNIPADAFREAVRALMGSIPAVTQPSKAASIRHELAAAERQLRDVLHATRRVGLSMGSGHALNGAFETLDRLSKGARFAGEASPAVWPDLDATDRSARPSQRLEKLRRRDGDVVEAKSP